MVLRGIHINKWTEGARHIVKAGRPGLVTSLDQNPEIFELKQEQGFFYVARRHFDSDAWWYPTPEQNAEYLFRIMDREFGPHKQHIDCILTPWNERGQRPHERMTDHIRGVTYFCQLAHEEGYKVGGPNFSVGNPEPEHMEDWAEALDLLDYFVLHEYWSWPGPYLNQPWWVGRWKRLYDALPDYARKPVIFGECGIDNQLIGRTVDVAGWRDAGLGGQAAVRYVQQINEFYATLDERVLGLALFNTGDHDNHLWKSFEFEGNAELVDWLAAGPAYRQEPEQPGGSEGKVETVALRELHPWPYDWNQLNDWSTDENGDQNKWNNCGPESLAACTKYLAGVELSADQIVEMIGNDWTGYTTVKQLTAWLRRYAEIETVEHWGDASTLLRPVVEEAINEGYPVVVLFFLDINKPETGHFCPVVGYDDQGIYRHQVLGGGREFMDWHTFEQWQKLGICFVLKRRRDGQLPAFKRAA